MDKACYYCENYNARLYSGPRNCPDDCIHNHNHGCHICQMTFSYDELTTTRYNGVDITVCEECYNTIIMYRGGEY